MQLYNQRSQPAVGFPQLQRRHRGQQTFVFCELKCLRRFQRTQKPQLSIVKRPVSRLLVCYFGAAEDETNGGSLYDFGLACVYVILGW